MIKEVIFLLNALLAALLSLTLQLAVHEFGHMFAGAVTGWRLIYLQVLNLALVRDKNCVRLKTVPASACRCIMYPKDLLRNASFYTLGGLFLNLLFTTAGVIGIVKLFDKPIAWMYAFGLTAFGVMFLITNGVPRVGKVCNDMACLLMIKNDKASKKYHNFQLIVARRLFDGMSYRQIDKELIEVGDTEIKTDIMAYQAVLEYYYHLDRDEYSLAAKSLEKIADDAQISQEVRTIITMERHYLDLIMDILRKEFKSEDSRNYLEGTKKLINENEVNGDIHSVRVSVLSEIYCYYMEGKIGEVIKCLDRRLKAMEGMRYLYLGEKLFCMDQLMGIRNMLQRDYLSDKRTGTEN